MVPLVAGWFDVHLPVSSILPKEDLCSLVFSQSGRLDRVAKKVSSLVTMLRRHFGQQLLQDTAGFSILRHGPRVAQ